MNSHSKNELESLREENAKLRIHTQCWMLGFIAASILNAAYAASVFLGLL